MTPAEIDCVFGRGRLRIGTGDHVEVFREAVAPGERRLYTKRFLATAAGDFREWTEREWRILARLVGHGVTQVPDIVQFDRGSAERPALVQTYDAGITVDHWATLLPLERDRTPLPNLFEDAAHWWALARASLKALDAIHELRVVHLDLKADNLCIPFDPPAFDPHAGDRALRPRFDELALIDFAFSLVSGEPLQRALPIAAQQEFEYQSPRLLQALEAGRRGDLGPTRHLDWRCDFFSLAAMLWRYLPEPEVAAARGWTEPLHVQAHDLVRQLMAAHDGEVAASRPHGALIALADAALGADDLQRSLERGWTLAVGADTLRRAAPTPITRIAPPLVAAPVAGAMPTAVMASTDGASAPSSIATAAVMATPPTPVLAPRQAEREATAGRETPTLDLAELAARRALPPPADPVLVPHDNVFADADATPSRRPRARDDDGAATQPTPRVRASVLRRHAAWGAAFVAGAALGTALWLRPGFEAHSPRVTAELARVAAAPTLRGSATKARPPRVAPDTAPAPEATPPPPAAAMPPESSVPASPSPAASPTPPAVIAVPHWSTPVLPPLARSAGERKAIVVPRARPTPFPSSRPQLAARTPATRLAAATPTPGAARMEGINPRGAATAASPRLVLPSHEAIVAAAQIRAQAQLHGTASLRTTPQRVGLPVPSGETVAWAVAGRTPASSPASTADGAAADSAPRANDAAANRTPVAPRPSPSPSPDAPAPASAPNSIDFRQRADDLMANHLPRVSQRAERLVARVLFTAARSDDVIGNASILDTAASLGPSSTDPLATLRVASDESQQLNDAARAEYVRHGATPQALTFLVRAFGADPGDPDIVGNLAFMLLRQRPAQPEAARRLALHALTLHGARYPYGRSDDWATLAIASALSGRAQDARNALLVSLAFAPDLDRQCRAALNTYATYGDTLRAPVEAMLAKARVARSQPPAACQWPTQWALSANVQDLR